MSGRERKAVPLPSAWKSPWNQYNSPCIPLNGQEPYYPSHVPIAHPPYGVSNTTKTALTSRKTNLRKLADSGSLNHSTTRERVGQTVTDVTNENLPPTTGRLGESDIKLSKKRQRGQDQNLEIGNGSANKRHQAHQNPIEVIDLVDDDCPSNSCASPLSPVKIYTSGVILHQKASNNQPHQPTCQQPQHEVGNFTKLPPSTESNPYKIASSPPSGSAIELPQPPEPVPNSLNLSGDVIPASEPELCKEQADLVELIVSGRNVFYTGSAGCGKSTVLKAFVKRLQEKGVRVRIVAPTGRAALHINGSTTWSYAGWTPDSHKKPLEVLEQEAHGKLAWQRLKYTDVLVIDEISMVENLHFERLNAIMKAARNKKSAFGGVQVVVTGDFCQLPPVKPFQHCIDCGRELIPNVSSTEYNCHLHGTYLDIDKWAFRSKAWKECNFAHVNLTQIHRQSDSVFINILQKLRMGRSLLPADTDLLMNHHSETRNAIKLFATRKEVNRVNNEMFAKLPSKARSYKCLDRFQWNPEHHGLKSKSHRNSVDGTLTALRDHRFDTKIQLKKGMLVVLLVNLDIDSGLVNGSQGTIQGFEEYDKAKMPKALKRGETDTTISGVPILSGEHAVFREHQIKQYVDNAESKAWPIVTFLNGATRTIYADCTVNEYGDERPYSLLSRTQIPLMAAWAITTHKSQGMTLNRVIVDLSKSFEQGQAYVALSRARSLEGLKVESFPQRAQCSGNEQVKEFLRDKFGKCKSSIFGQGSQRS